jgi:tetratricopeptide (TPR) repeat protein
VLPSSVAAFVATVGLSGCGGDASLSTGLDGALSAYNTSSYSLAYQRAKAVESAGSPSQRSKAALVAGQSALQLGRINEAELYLDRAARSSDEDVVARARASLGLLCFARGEYREAADLLLEAEPRLDSDDQAEARRFAARAYEAAGDPRRARAVLSRTGGGAIPYLETDRYSLQVGAFRDRQRAERAARSAAEDARAIGPDPVRIVTKAHAPAGVLHVVQFGSWTSRQAASRARSRLGHVEYLVARALEPAG